MDVHRKGAFGIRPVTRNKLFAARGALDPSQILWWIMLGCFEFLFCDFFTNTWGSLNKWQKCLFIALES